MGMNRWLSGTRLAGGVLALALVAVAGMRPSAAQTFTCERQIEAHVVALDQLYMWNRLGAAEPQGMIYALRRDVVGVGEDESDCDLTDDVPLLPGKVRLREGRRPRPLVLRMNVGDCLTIHFTNLLSPSPLPSPADDQPSTRSASIHVTGMQYVSGPKDGGMWIGNDPSGLVPPGGSIDYTIYAEAEGTYLFYNGAAMTGGEGWNGSISNGLFGAINVQPKGSRWFRSQVTQRDFELASSPGPDGFPVVDYTAKYPPSPTTGPGNCWRADTPILEMLHGNEIVHGDLTAIITGPDIGRFPDGTFNEIAVYWDRHEPYREFTIIFHDEIGAVQAFPHFEDEVLRHTLHSVRDAFAINYGTGGIGAEIIANRLGVGPMADCVTCKYEEFFLSAWTVGDPAMVVDVPANAPCSMKDLADGRNCLPDRGPKATIARYPDDPSNVYHSYLTDDVKFRNLHAGSDDHHIFHLHAHQWLRTPNSDNSAYLDSQAIGQNTSFTYEIAYEGSGNRNRTPGDSVFHCHFYPHFAQGMWAMWRVHDVLETGTELDEKGRPIHEIKLGGQVVTKTRALPDAEIRAGTPIPAVVPLPTRAMPPLPTPVQLVDGQLARDWITAQARSAYSAGEPFFSPGYPFYIPGFAGERPPQPPMDFAKDGAGNPLDGGLPRHVALDGDATSVETRLNFTKHTLWATVELLPDGGTELEQLAMKTHALSGFSTPTPEGVAGQKIWFNGADPVPGAPFADPCIADPPYAKVASSPARDIYYQGVDMELDVILNKEGWHFPQQRISVLRGDWADTRDGKRAPEPLFFRANSRDCVHFELTNLVPAEYQVDDFQVKTPTDILGQHIHLVKFDVTSSDGGANGWNYEDGSLAGEEVQEMIEAIRKGSGCADGVFNRSRPGKNPITGDPIDLLDCPVAKADPRFGEGPDKNCNGHPDYLGAQTTVQRWWADPVHNMQKSDRTLHTVFTHDHFGPSTHQQAGLYAGLVVEHEGSTWWHSETGARLGPNVTTPGNDGSPTSWQARIDHPETTNPQKNFREFMLEFGDFQLAYERNDTWKDCPQPDSSPTPGWSDPVAAINPPGRRSVGPHPLYLKPEVCPRNENDPDGPIDPALDDGLRPPCPEAVSADDPGFVAVNYRNEPLALRLSEPSPGPGGVTSARQARGLAGDPSYAYESRTDRARPEFNKVPKAPDLAYVPYPALTRGLRAGDPFTPLIRVYEGDSIKIKTLVGAHEEEHNFMVHGLRWLREPEDRESGYRNSQMMTISEWFEMAIPAMPNLQEGESVDLLYKPSAATEWQWNGAWGLIRVYRGEAATSGKEEPLSPLLSNADAKVGDTERPPFGEAPADKLAPQRVDEATPQQEAALGAGNTLKTACPDDALQNRLRQYEIVAVAAREVLPVEPSVGDRTLVYNRRHTAIKHETCPCGVEECDTGPDGLAPARDTWGSEGPLHDPTAILFVEKQDLIYDPFTGRPRLKDDAPVEPIILRAQAGECVEVTLYNDLPPAEPDPEHPEWAGFGFDLDGWNGWHMIIEHFNANDVFPSREVGLHAQLVHYDPAQADGNNVGINRTLMGHPRQTVPPGYKITYYWYAGAQNQGNGPLVPIEFGTAGLTSSDPLKHTNKGAVGALIVEPDGATWDLTGDRHPYESASATRRTRAEARVTTATGEFREFVTVFQDDVNLRYAKTDRGPRCEEDSIHNQYGGRFSEPVASLIVSEDPTESAQKGFGYRTEPIWYRMGFAPENVDSKKYDYADVLTDMKVGGRPVTHIFDARPGEAVRFRVSHPGGHTQNHVWEIQGHIWQETPYELDANNEPRIGDRPESQWVGSRYGVGPGEHADVVPPSGAGGRFVIAAEYLYRDHVAWGFGNGMWGLFKVFEESPKPPPREPDPQQMSGGTAEQSAGQGLGAQDASDGSAGLE
ncbi:MAG: copper oxidase [Acidobacteria bacterium]|nr:MAG: copper oxidase [Acidobacteriota bacterium]